MLPSIAFTSFALAPSEASVLPALLAPAPTDSFDADGAFFVALLPLLSVADTDVTLVPAPTFLGTLLLEGLFLLPADVRFPVEEGAFKPRGLRLPPRGLPLPLDELLRSLRDVLFGGLLLLRGSDLVFSF